jgi:2-phospho-L-lactate guanylyltransferase
VLHEAQACGHSAAAMAGFLHARAHGAVSALTLPADAPGVTPGEVSRLIDAAWPVAGPRVVLVPSHDRDGTNGVLAAPPDAFPVSFGRGSFARHLALAEAQGLDCRVVELDGLGQDVDEPRDLQALIARKRGDPAYAFLQGQYRPPLETSAKESSA